MKGILGLLTVIVFGTVACSPAGTARAHGSGTVSCGSDRGRRATCGVPWRDARLVRQESRSACVRGDTWGMDRRGIWVDDGCRGIFEEAHGWRGGGYGRHDRYDDHEHYHDHHDDRRPRYSGRRGGDGRIVSCDSNDKKRVFCRWPIGRGARLVEQTSRSDCVEGHSYGFARDGIWASRGCRGRFDIGD